MQKKTPSDICKFAPIMQELFYPEFFFKNSDTEFQIAT